MNIQKPNIIFFLTDDLGYGDVSCMNPESKIHTENIDRLAREGMRFTDCHASSAVCSPSRYALMTGRYNWRSELKNLVLPGVSRALIEPGRETIASMLKKQGYRTACVGKWHLGMDWETVGDTKLTIHMPEVDKRRDDLGLDYTKPIKNGPNAKGFDYYFGMAASLDQAPYMFIENDMAQAVPDCIIGSDDCDHASPGTEFLYDKGPAWSGFDLEQAVPTCDQKVLDLIDQWAGQEEPFFIYYPTLAVHGPLLPTNEFKGKSGLGAYGDFVLQVDAFIGRLEAKLDEKGIADNTIVVFTSDNGCSSIVGFEALAKHGHNPNYIFRGSKSDIWEGGHRVPMVIRWPGHIQPGTTCEQTMCLVDFFATFAQLTGYQIPDNAAEDSASDPCPLDGGQPGAYPGGHRPPLLLWLLFHPQGGLEAGDVQRLRRRHPAQLGARGGRPTAHPALPPIRGHRGDQKRLPGVPREGGGAQAAADPVYRHRPLHPRCSPGELPLRELARPGVAPAGGLDLIPAPAARPLGLPQTASFRGRRLAF